MSSMRSFNGFCGRSVSFGMRSQAGSRCDAPTAPFRRDSPHYADLADDVNDLSHDCTERAKSPQFGIFRSNVKSSAEASTTTTSPLP